MRIKNSTLMSLASAALLSASPMAGLVPEAPKTPLPIVQRKGKGKGRGKPVPNWHNKRGGKYMPAGPRANVAGNYVKNSLQAENINKHHKAWHLNKFGTEANFNV